MQYNNILVIQTAFIGDAILASSVLEKLHVRFPSAKISVLVRNGNQSIFQNHPFLSETLIWHKKERKTKALLILLKQIRKRKFDCVINCHRYLSSGVLSAFSGARHVAGFKENPLSFLFNTTARHKIGDGAHEIERYQRLISELTSGPPAKPRLYPAETDEKITSELKQTPYVCLAPASVWFTKQMPAEKWVALCNRIPAHTNIYLLGAPGDAALCEEIQNASLHEKIKVLAGQLSLLQSAALMRDADMNFVNDSAPLHIASAMDAPVTVFFCSTVPGFGFGPLSTDSRIIQVADLPCKPCGIRGYRDCPLGHFKCGRLMPLPDMTTITVNEKDPPL